jgi:hypothetical protein
VQRVPAAQIAQGRGNWLFRRVAYNQGTELSLIVMTTQKGRKNGHIGISLNDVHQGRTTMAHMSSKLGFVTMPLDKERALDWHIYMKQTVGN